jgi:hypothetical protein
VGVDRIWVGGQSILVLVSEQCGAIDLTPALVDAGESEYLDLLVCFVRAELAGVGSGDSGTNQSGSEGGLVVSSEFKVRSSTLVEGGESV